MKYSLRGHTDGYRHKGTIKRSGQARLTHAKDINCSVTSPPREGDPVGIHGTILVR